MFPTESLSLIEGGIDMHAHADPDVYVARRMDCVEMARMASTMGIRGYVLKCHQFPTGGLAYLVRKAVPNFEAFGSICLNRTIGGLNVEAMIAATRFAYHGKPLTKVVWMPTHDAASYLSWKIAHNRPVQPNWAGYQLTDGNMATPLKKVLDVVAETNMVLATGHISKREAMILVRQAHDAGVNNIVITHVDDEYLGYTMEDQKELAKEGAFMEHCLGGCMPIISYSTIPQLVSSIKEVGPRHCIIGTDMGQLPNPPPPEGFRMLADTLKASGIGIPEIRMMAADNPAVLLGLGQR